MKAHSLLTAVAAGLLLLPACGHRHEHDQTAREEDYSAEQLERHVEQRERTVEWERQARDVSWREEGDARLAAAQVEAEAQPDRADVAAGHEPVEQRIANNIRGTLATITEAALTKQQFRSVVQRLSEGDRQRIGDFADREFPELDARIAQFQDDWRDRYGQPFSLEQRELVYHSETVQIVQGWTEQAELARQRQVGEIQARHEQRMGRQPEPEQEAPQRQDVQAEDGAPADARADEQQRATVIIPASHGLPELSIPMINEGTIMDAWRIEAPDHLEGPRLVHNLGHQLTMANLKKDQWPPDVNDAYLMVSHHVLMAVMDVEGEE